MPPRPPTPTARWCWWRGWCRARRSRSARRTAPAWGPAPRRSPRSRCRRPQRGQVGGGGQAAASRLGVGRRHDALLDALRQADSIFATPASTNRCSTSRATTTWPASRHTWAMPAPIVPSPTTPTVPIDTRLPPLASAVIVLAAQAGNRRSAGYTGSMARFRDRLRMPTRDRNDAVVIDDGPAPRSSSSTRSRRSSTASSPASSPPPSPTRAATRRALRRERQGLVAEYERLVMDLGGLVVEMARRGVHNHALVDRRAADVVELERRIAELDGRLLAEAEVRRGHRFQPECVSPSCRHADLHATRAVGRYCPCRHRTASRRKDRRLRLMTTRRRGCRTRSTRQSLTPGLKIRSTSISVHHPDRDRHASRPATDVQTQCRGSLVAASPRHVIRTTSSRRIALCIHASAVVSTR